VESNIILDSVN